MSAKGEATSSGKDAAPASFAAAKQFNRPHPNGQAAPDRSSARFDPTGILAGVYVTVVRVDDAHYRRRVYLSLAPAEAAVRRAEARGHLAEVVLCRLEPIGGESR